MDGFNTLRAALVATTVAVTVAAFATTATARTTQRQGFNFGTTVRAVDTNEHTLAGLGSDKNTKTDTSSQAVNPFVGYAFGAFDLGLMVSAETKETHQTEDSADGSATTDRRSTLTGKGVSLFARFLFGDYFFFETGGGLYQEDLSVAAETKSLQPDGSFTGSRDNYDVKGIGPGYHVGAGIELAMGGGFFFTTAYQVRMVSLRDYKGGSDLGSKRSQTQKREVLFGIEHYLK
jgi:hypothetical protein